MKIQTTSGVVGGLALGATLWLALQPAPNRAAPGSGVEPRMNGGAARAGISKPGTTNYRSPCADISDVLLLSLGLNSDGPCHPSPAGPKESTTRPAESQRQSKDAAKGAAGSLGLKFIIATLPDPLHTHLALMFDRMTDVIEDATSDEQYSYEASWLPWDDKEEPRTYSYLKDQDIVSDRADEREKQPGILIFRDTAKPAAGNPDPSHAPYKGALVVFVVGEDPTRGIHVDQFRYALAWIDALHERTQSTGVALLGPTFSGSFPSLAKLLSEDAAFFNQPNGAATPPLAIYTGTANSQSQIESFKDTLGADSKLKQVSITFHPFLELDEVGLARLYGLLQHNNGCIPVALLSEDETAFGGGTNQSREVECSQGVNVLRLSYPRDISRLRAAYQSNSIFDTPQARQNQGAVRVRLPTNLADPEGIGHDTIQSYAGDQGPLSEEAYMLGVVKAMQEHRSEYVILRSTNPFDQLFLAEYLKRAAPDVQIVIDDADRLFERESSSAGILGSLSLSSYPLLEMERNRVGESMSNYGHRSFDSDYSEGTYIALRFLLHTATFSRVVHDPCQLPVWPVPGNSVSASVNAFPALPAGCTGIPDYGTPSWMKPADCDTSAATTKQCEPFERPATWLSVLARDGYWPLAAMNEETIKGGPDVAREDLAIRIPVGLSLFWFVVTIFVGFHFWCCSCASFTKKPAFRAHFAGPDDEKHTLLVSLGSLFLAFLVLFIGWGCGLWDGSSAMLPHPWPLRAVLAIECFVALAASWANLARIESVARSSQMTPDSGSTRYGALVQRLAIVVYTGTGIFSFALIFVGPLETILLPANRLFTYYRSMSIFNGVSPIAPFLALAMGMYGWFWYSLHGLALFGPDRPRLPARSDLELQTPAAYARKHQKQTEYLRMFSREDAGDITERRAKPFAAEPLVWGAMLFVLLAVLWWILFSFSTTATERIRSLGPARYVTVFIPCLAGCAVITLVETAQLLLTWFKLRELLRFLDRTALRRTLKAMSGFSWGSVWTMSGNVLDVRYKLLSRQLETLQHTRNDLDNLTYRDVSNAEDAARFQEAADAIDEAIGKARRFAGCYAEEYNNRNAGNFRLLQDYQESAARTGGLLLAHFLLGEWRKEEQSLIAEDGTSKDDHETAPPLSKKPYVRNAEEFVCLCYLGFAQNVLGRIRTIVLAVLLLFVSATLAVSCYPFAPRQGLVGAMILLFLLLGGPIWYVYAQMHRDSTLSNLTNTKPGELGLDFWLKLAAYGAAPALSLLATVFPEITNFIFSWIQPGLQAFK